MPDFTVNVIVHPSDEMKTLLNALLGAPLATLEHSTAAQGVPAVPTTQAALPVAAPASPPVTPAPQTAVPTAPPPAAVPTTDRAYTLEELARAGATLMDSGQGEAATAAMAQFGVQSLADLKPEQYGALATELRKLGAKI